MDHSERRELNNGFSLALGNAVELVLTPLVFAAAGHLVDRWLGIGPFFAIGLGAFTLGYVAWRMYADYSRAMQAEEDRILRRGRPGGEPA
ncbi:MAG: AtpZ/AtpI family protein [Acidimicrobiales bacterium]|nr:AtpZ/AtpI family protein [Acidimicrobiales bacterium]MCB1014191.1 AtpZ/AtpI family protein [Acidimicrobiales bacterium]MCB9372763.1 AtpZ/AtpI family protein [Microthrixaceae bacterium]